MYIENQCAINIRPCRGRTAIFFFLVTNEDEKCCFMTCVADAITWHPRYKRGRGGVIQQYYFSSLQTRTRSVVYDMRRRRYTAASSLQTRTRRGFYNFPNYKENINFDIVMRIVSKSTLKAFWEQHEQSDAEKELINWHKSITEGTWKIPQDVTAYFKDADFVGNGRIVFNICHNKYRLVVLFRFKIQICYIRFIGTHKAYDSISDIKNI